MTTVLDYPPGLTAQFPMLEDLATAVVYGHRLWLANIAARLDQSPSELSRRLNRDADDHRPLRVADLVGIIAATGDLRPIAWLLEKFHETQAESAARAGEQIAALLPMLAELAAQAGAKGPR